MAREDHYGTDFDWFAVDDCGHVAQLTAGYAPIPDAVFRHEPEVEAASTYFRGLLGRGTSRLRWFSRMEHLVGLANFSRSLEEARKGLFIYDESGPQGARRYKLHAVPGTPVTVNDLPESVRRVVTLAVLPSRCFRRTKTLNPEGLRA